MICIGSTKKGIIRDILTEARGLCIEAFQNKMSRISEEFVREGLSGFNESRTFYQILDTSEELNKAALRLCEFALLSNIDLKQASSTINNILENKVVKADSELLKALIDQGIIEVSAKGNCLLSIPISNLFMEIKKTGWNIQQFLSWIFEGNTIKILRGGIPGIGAKSAFEQFGPIPSTSKQYVDLIVGNVQEKIVVKQLLNDADSQLNSVRKTLNEIGTLSWDDIDNLSVFKKTFWSLEDFLSAFSKLYICCGTSQTIKLRSFKAFDLIENTIYHFQKEHKIIFKTLYRYLALRDLMKGLARGGFSPSYSHVKSAFEDFEEILKEFTNNWQKISSNFGTFQQVDDNYEKTLKDVKLLAKAMGFDIERPDYRRFEIDGERFYRSGFSKFPINEAMLDLVMENQVRNRFGDTKNYFFLASINSDSRKRAEMKDVLAFIARCEALIGIIIRDHTDAPTGWPKYFLLYISHNGFEQGIREAINSIALPKGCEMKTLDFFGINSLKRQLYQSKRISSEDLSEEDIEKLQQQDLEQLLRISYNTTRIIHQKFEKSKTILLADMVNFTQRTGRDVIESAEAVQKMSDVFMKNVKEYGGWGMNSEGDSFIATFEKPDQALMVALTSVSDLQAHNQIVGKEREIEVRIGICDGKVIFKGGRPFVGNATNTAARIMKKADVNQVIVSKDVYKQVSAFRNFHFESAGTKKLKGIDKPVQVYTVKLKEIPKKL